MTSVWVGTLITFAVVVCWWVAGILIFGGTRDFFRLHRSRQPYRSSPTFDRHEAMVLSNVELLRAAGARPFASSDKCAKCGSSWNVSGSKICTGRSWWRRCQLRAEHFHQHCRWCGADWIMAPKDVEL